MIGIFVKHGYYFEDGFDIYILLLRTRIGRDVFKREL